MTWSSDALQWLSEWSEYQGFWAAVQGIGTLVAAVAAIMALSIARSQLSQLTESNNLLAASNEAMTQSNIALTRPYVIVDFDLSPSIGRTGNIHSTTVSVLIQNVGKTPARNVTLKVDKPFAPASGSDEPGWVKAVEELNRVMDGETVIGSLTHVKPLKYYLDEAGDIMGRDDHPAERWTVTACYQDGEGRSFMEDHILELGPWRYALVVTDQLKRIGKVIEGLTYEVKTKRLPSLDFTFPEPTPHLQKRVGRPRLKRLGRRP